MPGKAKQPFKGEKTKKKTTKRPKNKAVKIRVVKTDFLNHNFSPYIIDLKEFVPRDSSQLLIGEYPTEDYFVASEAESPILKLEDSLKQSSRPRRTEASQDLTAQKIEKIRQEIEELEEVVEFTQLISEITEEIDDATKEIPRLPEIGQISAEEPVVFRVKKISLNPFTLTKEVVIYLDGGANRLVQPLRDLSLSPQVKAIIGFVIVALFLILPLGGLSYYQSLKGREANILNQAKAAASNLDFAQEAVEQKDYSLASQQFNLAYQKFFVAQKELESISKIVRAAASLLPAADKVVDTAEALLAIGQDLSLVGQNLTAGLDNWEHKDATVTEKIFSLKASLKKSFPLVKKINRALAKVDINQLPSEEQFRFVQMKNKMPLIVKSFDNFISLADFAEEVLGKNELRRYLLVFQNNHEIRPTGGFIGSFALVDIVNGEIRKMEIPGGGSYDLQGSLKAKVAAPQPLRLINPYWEFQDSNWFADWPTAARKIIWFYNQAGGPTVDGVIAINADLMEDLLGIIGPVEADNKIIMADNFFAVTQQAVEIDYDKAKNQPKEFIAKMAPEVLDKVLTADREKLMAIASLLNRALTTKDLQLYFTDLEVEKRLTDFGWQNSIKQTSGDYIMVVNANIAGQKTDGVIRQKILHQATIKPSGKVLNKVTIIRAHQGVEGELFYGVPNVNYLRLYVPLGSKLISASGLKKPPAELFKETKGEYRQDQDLLKISGLSKTDKLTGVKINQEFGKTVFGGWTQVAPGQTVITTFEYELPFRVSFAKYQTGFGWLNKLEEKLNLAEETTVYSLIAQKQSGVESEFYSLVDLPVDWQAVWQYPQDLKIVSGGLTYGDYLDEDKIYSVIFKK